MTEQTDSESPLVQLREVVKSFTGDDEGAPAVEVLRGVSIEIHEGETISIVGPSGSGKSTLLNIIAGLDQPTFGDVLFENRDISKLDEKELSSFRNRELGFVFQDHHLLPQCSVLENCLLPVLAGRRIAASDVARAEKLLERVGLAERTHYRPGTLSGGERQRAAVVRGLINQPRLLLADEPTGALDQETASGISDLLVKLSEDERITLLVVTHSQDLASRLQRRYRLRLGVLEPMKS